MLRDSASVLDASFEVGLSGPGRLHDLFVTHEAMSPGEWKSGGVGLTIAYGFHPSPFGTALVMATERGLAGLAFADPGEEPAALADMRGRWPKAALRRGQRAHRAARPPHLRQQAVARRPAAARRAHRHRLRGAGVGDAAARSRWAARPPIRTSPSRSAADKAARAVGAAVGKNPMSFVVPCHRVLGKSGDITGYHWGLTRKRAMLGWEAGRVGGA